MDVCILKSTAKGSVMAPPSKSLAHRYIICAALAKGKSVIRNVDLSEDIKATIDCIKAIGAGVSIDNMDVTIDGIGLGTGDYQTDNSPDEISFKCRESGSTMRFFMGIAMYLGKASRFYGSQTLRNRPFGIYEEICQSQSIDFERKDDYIYLSGKLGAGNYELKGNVSSQFITGLMFVLPLLETDSVIKLIPPVESRSYINLTIQALNFFGVDVSWKTDEELYIKGGQCYMASDEIVEGDCSNAAFFEAFNYIGGDVQVLGTNPDTLQGDAVYRELFDRLKSANYTGTVDISDCPDLGPVLFAMAAALNGGKFTGTRRLKMKESDRGTVMCAELKKFGVDSRISENEIEIEAGRFLEDKADESHTPKEELDGHNDHRIVMSLALLCSILGGKITGAQAVTKSYPGFFEDIKKLGVEVSIGE